MGYANIGGLAGYFIEIAIQIGPLIKATEPLVDGILNILLGPFCDTHYERNL